MKLCKQVTKHYGKNIRLYDTLLIQCLGPLCHSEKEKLNSIFLADANFGENSLAFPHLFRLLDSLTNPSIPS